MNIKEFILSNLAEVDTYFDKARFRYDGEVMDFVFDNFHVVHNEMKTSLVSIALGKVRFPDFLDVAREVSV